MSWASHKTAHRHASFDASRTEKNSRILRKDVPNKYYKQVHVEKKMETDFAGEICETMSEKGEGEAICDGIDLLSPAVSLLPRITHNPPLLTSLPSAVEREDKVIYDDTDLISSAVCLLPPLSNTPTPSTSAPSATFTGDGGTACSMLVEDVLLMLPGTESQATSHPSIENTPVELSVEEWTKYISPQYVANATKREWSDLIANLRIQLTDEQLKELRLYRRKCRDRKHASRARSQLDASLAIRTAHRDSLRTQLLQLQNELKTLQREIFYAEVTQFTSL